MGARCILVNERGAEQRMVSLLERRGIVVVKLLDQVRWLLHISSKLNA